VTGLAVVTSLASCRVELSYTHIDIGDDVLSRHWCDDDGA